MKTKQRMIDTMVFPVAVCGCESWSLQKTELRRIRAFEMWCWRRLLRLSWTEKRKNAWVLEKINPSQSLEEKIVKQKLGFFGCVARKDGSLEKTIMLGEVGGKRTKGRPRMRWLDDIKLSLNVKSINVIKEMARKRKQWRELLYRVAHSRNRPGD